MSFQPRARARMAGGVSAGQFLCHAGLPAGAGGTAAYQIDQTTKDFLTLLKANTPGDCNAGVFAIGNLEIVMI